MSISQTIADFVTLAIQSGGWMEMDRLYLQNRVAGLIGVNSLEKVSSIPKPKSSLFLLNELIQQAIKNNIIHDIPSEKERFEVQLTDLLTPPPSVVNAFFAKHYANNPQEATTYFYELCQKNGSIKTKANTEKTVFPIETEYGCLKISINEGEIARNPEVIVGDQRDINRANYPQCPLCMENEGYQGRSDYLARTNHRIIRMNLDGESWGFQYALYAYYNEHATILSEEHRPRTISKKTFQRLLKIVEVLPHYFAGADADLSTLYKSTVVHDHYQAGNQVFPLELAEIETYFELTNFPLMNAGIVKWPMSVIRLQSPNAEDLIQAGELILEKWRNYSDKTLGIKAFAEDGTAHHSITTIARRKKNLFELDLVLRDNQVSKEHPLSIFCSHQAEDGMPIKLVRLGLMEAMGLMVFPVQLVEVLAQVENYILGEKYTLSSEHKEWADGMKENYIFNEINAMALIQQEVGEMFISALEDASVYKRHQQGQQGFQRFIKTLSV